MTLETRQPSGLVYRLGRSPNAWQPPEWSLVHADGTFGNRFDDPEGYYRVLYASSQRVACFVETLARFRPDLGLLAELSTIDGSDDFFPLGTVPRDWLDVRTMGRAEAEGTYADIYAAGWVSHLRRILAAEALRLGVKDIDLSTLQMAEPRRLTQLASREVYRSRFAGVFTVRGTVTLSRIGLCLSRSSWCVRHRTRSQQTMKTFEKRSGSWAFASKPVPSHALPSLVSILRLAKVRQAVPRSQNRPRT